MTEQEELELLRLRKRKAMAMSSQLPPTPEEKPGLFKRIWGALKTPERKASELLQKYVPSQQIEQAFPTPSPTGNVPLDVVMGTPAIMKQSVAEAAKSVAPGYLNPIVAATGLVGKAIPPIARATGVSGLLEKAAIPMARRSLGFMTKDLKNPLVRAQAKEAAKQSIEQEILGLSTEGMLGKAEVLAQKTGRRIGSFLEEAGKANPIQKEEAVKALESLKKTDATGEILKGGEWDRLNRAIDNGVETVKAFKTDTINFKEANSIKGALQDAARQAYNATLHSGGEHERLVAGAFRKFVDDTITKAVNTLPVSEQAPIARFIMDKKMYGAAEKMVEALNYKLAREQGNQIMALTWYKDLGKFLGITQPLIAKALYKAPQLIGSTITGTAAATPLTLGAIQSQLKRRRQ